MQLFCQFVIKKKEYSVDEAHSWLRVLSFWIKGTNNLHNIDSAGMGALDCLTLDSPRLSVIKNFSWGRGGRGAA